MSSAVRISHYINSTEVLGPGKRFVIWFQGCRKRCHNCINPDGQAEQGGKLVSVESLFSEIVKTEEIQGITISGGEPFLQFEPLRELIEKICRDTRLDVMLYSGYTLEELKQQLGDTILNDFLQKIDIFIDGEYIEQLDKGSMYRGSDNQKIYFFTEKYRPFAKQIYEAKNREIEFDVRTDEEIYMIGIPPKNFYNEFIQKIGEVR